MGKHQISMADTISTRTFMNDYLGVKYDLEGILTHDKMIEYLKNYGKSLPIGVNMDYITKEDIALGRVLLVREERKSSKRKCNKSYNKVRVLAYRNPLYLKEERVKENLFKNCTNGELKKRQEELRKKRNEYLITISLIEDEFGNIMDLETYERYSSEFSITTGVNRSKVMKIKCKSMRKRGR